MRPAIFGGNIIAVLFNKILKVLEEPYPQTLFLLVSEEPELLLSTILSRVQQIPVPLIAENDIAAALLKPDEEISEQTANDIAHIACGSYSKALQALQTNSNTQVYFESFKALGMKKISIHHS